MDIAVDLTNRSHRLVDPSGFTSFRVTVTGADGAAGDPVDAATMARVVDQLGELVTRSDDGHVWLDGPGVRAMAGDAADAEWDEGFAAMVAFAESKGWTEGSGIRAHLDRI